MAGFNGPSSMSGATSGFPNIASPEPVDSSPTDTTPATRSAVHIERIKDDDDDDDDDEVHSPEVSSSSGGHDMKMGEEERLIREERLRAENNLLGDLVMQLREERDLERSNRIAAEARESEAAEKLTRESKNASVSEPAAKARQVDNDGESKVVREELESLALDLQDQLKECKGKVDRYDDAMRELEAERQKRILMEEVIAASPESGHIADLNKTCEELQERLREAEEKLHAAEKRACDAAVEVVKLREEAGMRESLLEREINSLRASDEEEITRLRIRVRALEKKEEEEEEDANAYNYYDDNRKYMHATASVPLRGMSGAAISEMHKPEATTELHLHALSLIRDRSRLLRRLHRAETDTMLLRVQVSKLESSVIAGGELARVDAVVKAAKAIASELGLAATLGSPTTEARSVESLLGQVRSLFLSKPPDTSVLPTLPIEMILAYTRSIEQALVQSKVDHVTLRQQVEDSTKREAEAARMLIEATDRESASAEVC